MLIIRWLINHNRKDSVLPLKKKETPLSNKEEDSVLPDGECYKNNASAGLAWG